MKKLLSKIFMLFAFMMATIMVDASENINDMFRLTSNTKIFVNNYKGVVNCEVTSSYEDLTDMAKISFPRKFDWDGEELATGDQPLLRVGDEVNLEVGYNDNNSKVFEGFIQRINVDIPTTIHCQDAMYLLKQKTFTKSYKDAKLSDILEDILPASLPYAAPDIRLGQLRFSKMTAAQFLNELRTKFYLSSWFRDGKLYSGLNFVPELQRSHFLNFHRNVVSNDLQFTRAEDIKIKLKVISIAPDNERKEYEFGDTEGEQRTLHVFDKNREEIEFFAQQKIEELRYTGYRGNLTVFLMPQINHGDFVTLDDPDYPERNGTYLVKKVVTTFGQNGGRQQLELDARVS